MKTVCHKLNAVAVLIAITVVSSEAFSLFHNKLNSKRSKNLAKPESNDYDASVPDIKLEHDFTNVIKATLYSTIELNCKGTSSPTPTIHWLLNGSRLYQEFERLSDDEAAFENTERNRKAPLLNRGSTDAKLVIDCLTPEDAGVYTCVTQTPMGRQINSTKVIVLDEVSSEAKKCTSKKEMKGVAPVIYMHTSMRFERQGADVQLFCRASGSPRPKIVWTNNLQGTKIIGNGHKKYKVLPNGDLFIRSVSWEDMGSFTCRAQNNFGKDSQAAFFYPLAN